MKRHALFWLPLFLPALVGITPPAQAVVPSARPDTPRITATTAPAVAPFEPVTGLTPSPTPRQKTVALTFDDGPRPGYTLPILAVLRKHKVKATFCVLGDAVGRYPGTTRRISAEGHQLCNHTRSHPDMALLSPAAAHRQVLDAQAQIERVSGVVPTTFRFPYGSSDARVRKVVGDMKLRALGWDIDTQDWQRPAASTITARIVDHVRPGDIVLMHDGGGDRSTTLKSLDATITQLKRKGYTFVLA